MTYSYSLKEFEVISLKRVFSIFEWYYSNEYIEVRKVRKSYW